MGTRECTVAVQSRKQMAFWAQSSDNNRRSISVQSRRRIGNAADSETARFRTYRGHTMRRSRSVLEERSQWTGRTVQSPAWEPAFQDILHRLHIQDPSLHRVCCADDPDV